MKNKYSINYTQHGYLTMHSFDTVKELKAILNDLQGIQVKPMPSEFMPDNMYKLCLMHNDKTLLSI